MAEDNRAQDSSTSSNSEANRLAGLRSLAQRHLEEISQEEEREREQEEHVKAVLGEESSRRTMSKQMQGTDSASAEKGSRMRSAEGTLDLRS